MVILNTKKRSFTTLITERKARDVFDLRLGISSQNKIPVQSLCNPESSFSIAFQPARVKFRK